MAVLRDMLNIGTQANLYNYVITDEVVVGVYGTTSWGDIVPKYYRYDVTSTATDDGENVIKPTSVMGAGRYLKLGNAQYVADWNQSDANAYDFIKNKPTIPSNTTQISEGNNLYYTDTRSRGAVSLTTVGSGAATYNSATGVLNVPTVKRIEAYSGTTDASGNYTVTFGASFSVAPNIQANIIGGTNTNFIKISSVSTTGFTVNVTSRTDVAGLLPTYSNVSGASVDVMIFEK